MTDKRAILEEALIPELSDDFFIFEGRKVQIKPLKVKYQKQFAKAFAPVLTSMAMEMANDQYKMVLDENGRSQYANKGLMDLSVANWISMASGVIREVDTLPELIQIICHNDGYEVTDEQLDDSTMQLKEMQEIIVRYIRKTGEIEKQVADFFLTVLPVGQSKLVELLGIAKQTVEKVIGKPIFTEPSEPSADTTAGDSEKSSTT